MLVKSLLSTFIILQQKAGLFLLVFSLCILLLSARCLAQTDSLYDITPETKHDLVHFHVSAAVAAPMNELRDAVQNRVGKMGFGISSGILLNPFGKSKPSPFLVGADFSYISYGVDKVAENSDHPPLKTAFNVYTVSGSVRALLTQRSGFAPFIDGLLGVQTFNTRTKIDKTLLQTVINDDQPEVLNTTNDTGLNYGLGVGFFIRNAGKTSNYAIDAPTPWQIRGSFSVRLLYYWGDEIKYVKRNSVTVTSDNFLTFETGRTRTDMLVLQVGFTLY